MNVFGIEIPDTIVFIGFNIFLFIISIIISAWMRGKTEEGCFSHYRYFRDQMREEVSDKLATAMKELQVKFDKFAADFNRQSEEKDMVLADTSSTMANQPNNLENTPAIPISEAQTPALPTQNLMKEELRQLGLKLKSGIKGEEWKKTLQEYKDLKQKITQSLPN